MRIFRNSSILLSVVFLLSFAGLAKADCPMHAAAQGNQGTLTGGAVILEDRSPMMLQQLGPTDRSYDRRFIDMLIQHHSEAIVAGQDAAKKAQHPELKQFAQKMTNEQRRDIQQLQIWRKQWYGQ